MQGRSVCACQQRQVLGEAMQGGRRALEGDHQSKIVSTRPGRLVAGLVMLRW
jgi:hypothetical protein